MRYVVLSAGLCVVSGFFICRLAYGEPRIGHFCRFDLARATAEIRTTHLSCRNAGGGEQGQGRATAAPNVWYLNHVTTGVRRELMS